MHDRKLHDPEPAQLSLPEINAIVERLREEAEAPFVIGGVSYYVFRPFKGRNGFYDRQVNDDQS